MKLFGKEFTKTEFSLLIIILLLLNFILFYSYIEAKAIEDMDFGYKSSYLECMKALNDYQNPMVDVWGNNHMNVSGLNWSSE
jgi:regulatory protein YycI of two-component signal transduction system YycFG